MTAQDFDKIVKFCINRITKMLGSTKADEYNLNKGNRFDTFYHGAAMSGEAPEQVLYGFMLKHLVSVTDMVQSGQKFTAARFIEKVIDLANYEILLLGILADQNKFTDFNSTEEFLAYIDKQLEEQELEKKANTKSK